MCIPVGEYQQSSPRCFLDPVFATVPSGPPLAHLGTATKTIERVHQSEAVYVRCMRLCTQKKLLPQNLKVITINSQP